jgi:hypothetical protein
MPTPDWAEWIIQQRLAATMPLALGLQKLSSMMVNQKKTTGRSQEQESTASKV